jgi:hypothetical protein
MEENNNVETAVAYFRSHTPSVHERDLNHEWNSNHEQLLKTWGESCQRYATLHQLTSEYYSRWHKWFGIPCKVLLSFIGSVMFAQLSNVSSDVLWPFYLTGALAVVGLIIEMAQDFLGFGEAATINQATSANYSALYMDIATELSHPSSRRTNVRAFLRTVKDDLKQLKKITSSVPRHIVDNYLSTPENSVYLARSIAVTTTTNTDVNVDGNADATLADVDANVDANANVKTNNPNNPVNFHPHIPTPHSLVPTSTLVSVPVSVVIEPLSPEPLEELEDLQNEFDREMARKMRSREAALEEYHLKRS